MKSPALGNICPVSLSGNAGTTRYQSHQPFEGNTPFEKQRMKDETGNVWVFAICKYCGSGFAAIETKKEKG